jgi:hypothetical protein
MNSLIGVYLHSIKTIPPSRSRNSVVFVGVVFIVVLLLALGV